MSSVLTTASKTYFSTTFIEYLQIYADKLLFDNWAAIPARKTNNKINCLTLNFAYSDKRLF